MPRVTTRSFLAQLRSAGVDDIAKGPNVSEDIQLVYVVDDLSRLIAPRSPVEAYANQGVPSAVGRVSGIQFTPPSGSAAVVTWMRNGGAIDSLYIVVAPGGLELTDDLNPGAIDFTTGPGAARGSFIFGSKAVQTAGLLLPAGENIPDRHPDIVLEPGQIFLWVGVSVGNGMTMTWTWREVPV